MQNVVERVLNLLIYLLESPRPVTADDIRYTVQGYGQESDDAFHRMFERDKDLLRRMGVPLKLVPLDAWEVEFGYTVDPDEYALDDPGLTQEEKVALSVAARMVRLGGSHLGVNALLKLGGVERVAGMEPLGADLGAEAEVLGDLFEAVTRRSRVTFRYRDQERRLEPWGLAHRRGHWYVAGNTPDGERVYRVDRMERVEVDEATDQFRRPKDFDIRRVLDGHPWEAGEGDEVEARVRFDAKLAWWAARTLGVEAPPEGEPLEATVPVVNRDAFLGWVLSFGAGAEILEPDDLRAEVVERVRGALEALG
jgi:proteasome accessory factor B